jgi:small subunit ribosomal protein S8
MTNDTLANTLSTIQQAESLGRTTAIVPGSKVIARVLDVLREHGYVSEFAKAEGEHNKLLVHLSGAINQCGVIKPRYNVKLAEFEKFEKRYLPAKGMGILIVSTPQGIATHRISKERKSGGRLLAYCY